MITATILLLAVVLLVLQSVLHTLVPTAAPLPALALYTPIYFALSARWSLPAATALGFLLGYLFDLVSGAPVGVHAVAMPAVVLLAALLGTRLQVRGPFGRALAVFLLTLVHGAVLLGLGRIVGMGAHGKLGRALLEAAMSAALAPLVYAAFDRIERRFDRAAVRMRPRGGGRLDTGIELQR